MKKELMKNTVIIAIGKFSTQVISYFLLPLYTSILSPSEYGIYDFIVTLYVFIVPFITLLMEESMFRFLIDDSSEKGKRRIISNTFFYVLISSILSSLILLVIFKLINFKYGLTFILYIFSSVFIVLCNAITRGLGKLNMYALFNFILSILTIVLNILLIVPFRLGVNGLLYATIIANFITGICIFIKLRIYKFISFKKVEKKELKEMIKYSYPLVPNSIGWSIINISDRLIITTVLGTAANGIYAMANKFPNIINTFSSFFFTAFKENASKAIKDKNYEEYYTSIQDIVHKAFIAISMLLIVIIPFVFDLFINKSYSQSYYYIPILVIALYYGNMSGFYGSLFVAVKDTKIIGKTTTLGAIINIVINLALIKFIGIYAAVISTLLANYIVNLYRKKQINQYIKLGKINQYASSLILLFLISSLYYINNIYINIFSLFLVIIYNYIINKNLIKNFISMIKKS